MVDLCIIAKDSKLLLEQLNGKPYEFELKGSGPVNSYLGCGFERDSDGTLCMNPGKHIKKMVAGYE